MLPANNPELKRSTREKTLTEQILEYPRCTYRFKLSSLNNVNESITDEPTTEEPTTEEFVINKLNPIIPKSKIIITKRQHSNLNSARDILINHFKPTHIFHPNASSSGPPRTPPTTPVVGSYESPIKNALSSDLTVIDNYDDELEYLLLPPPPKLYYGGGQLNGYPRQIWFINWVDEYEKSTKQHHGLLRKKHNDLNPHASKKHRIH